MPLLPAKKISAPKTQPITRPGAARQPGAAPAAGLPAMGGEAGREAIECQDDSDCGEGYTCHKIFRRGVLIRSKCRKKGEPPPDGNPCTAGKGYKGKNVKGMDGKWHLITPCREGHKSTQSGDGLWWCCEDIEPPPDKNPCANNRGIKKKANQACRPKYIEVNDEDGIPWCCREGKKNGNGDDCPEGYRAGGGPIRGGPPLSPTGASLPEQARLCKEGWTYKTIDGEGWCCKSEQPEDCEGGYLLSSNPILPGGGAIWTDEIIKAEHGWSRDPSAEAHFIWHKDYGYQLLEDVHNFIQSGTALTKTTTGACKNGFSLRGGWCCPGENGNGGPGGTFQWGENLQGLLARIMERANYLLDYPRGLTDAERQMVINYAIEGVKRGERGAMQSRRDVMARMGLAGSGIELEEMGRIQRETREQVSDVQRGVAVEDLDTRFNELMGTTGMVGDLTRLLMTGEQVPEVLSAARRSEGMMSMNAILSYLASIMGGQQSGYWQAILTQLMSGGGKSRV